MNALDTNNSHDSRDRRKQEKAQTLISTVNSIALLWQVGCEFVAAARKLQPFGFSPEQAWEALADMQAMADVVVLPDVDSWTIARDLSQRLDLHFWDTLVVAGCIRGGVETLYTEDFGSIDSIEGVRAVNPFL